MSKRIFSKRMVIMLIILAVVFGLIFGFKAFMGKKALGTSALSAALTLHPCIHVSGLAKIPKKHHNTHAH